MKKTMVLLVFGYITLTVQAQDPSVKDLQKSSSREDKEQEKEGWYRNGTFIFNLNQGMLRNWAAGGEENTLGINSVLNYNIGLRRGKHTWDNYVDLALGFQNATSFRRFRKTDDRIDLTTKYGYRLAPKWYAAFLANFNSQSLPGYDYTDTTDTKISNFLSPGKVLLSLGIDFRPNKDLSVFISPVTTRWIIKRDTSFFAVDKFGVPAYRKSYNEVGAYLTAKYTKAITKWATYTGRLDLFSNYRRNPQNVDLFFTNLLSMKFNKWLGTNISLDMIYDDDVVGKLQLKEILGVGVTLKL